MKSSDLKNLSNVYVKILTEDVGLGGHVSGTTQGISTVGVNLPDTAANSKIPSQPQKTETDIKSAIEELKSIFQELKNAQKLEPWVASKLATAGDRINSIHNYLIGTNR
jgi:hypothetical protein